jgi:hypothetical protein
MSENLSEFPLDTRRFNHATALYLRRAQLRHGLHARVSRPGPRRAIRLDAPQPDGDQQRPVLFRAQTEFRRVDLRAERLSTRRCTPTSSCKPTTPSWEAVGFEVDAACRVSLRCPPSTSAAAPCWPRDLRHRHAGHVLHRPHRDDVAGLRYLYRTEITTSSRWPPTPSWPRSRRRRATTS